MGIEFVKFNRGLALAVGPAAENFRIDANSRLDPAKSQFSTTLIKQEIVRLLSKPPYRRTFIIGSLTSRIDPTSGRMSDEDIEFIEGLHQFYEEHGVDAHSSFKRESYGQIGIIDEYATLLDKLAIEASHVLTVLPGSAKSPGTWEEIRYGAALGKSFLFIFKNWQETKFRMLLRKVIANVSTHPFLVFVSYDSQPELLKQIEKVWRPALGLETTVREWESHVE